MRIDELNQKELNEKTSIEASWHNDYNDTSYVYVGGLPAAMTEGDLLVLFSQYGNPVHVEVARHKITNESKGYGFVKYEDQRSTVLAVDNFNGIKILENTLKVDHAYYRGGPEKETPSLAVLYDTPSLADIDKPQE